MKSSKHLASKIGLVAAAATLLAASTFAESSPSEETRGRNGLRAGTSVDVVASNDGGWATAGAVNGNRSQNNEGRISREQDRGRSRDTRGDDVRGSYDRNDGNRDRGGRINGDGDRRSSDDQWRGENRSDRGRGGRDNDRDDRGRGGWDRDDHGRNDRDRGDWNRNDRGRDGQWNNSHRRNDGYRANGRITRVTPYSSGYRVWVAGAPYPFYVPHRYWDRDRFRIGVVINLGGYYDTRGYYDYDPYFDQYYGDRDYSDFRGVVERVDRRSNAFVVRDRWNGNWITVYSRDRWTDVRPGDYVEVNGRWGHRGTFVAWDVDVLRRRW